MRGITSELVEVSSNSVKKHNNALLIAVLVYLVTVVGWTLVFFTYVSPFIRKFVLTHMFTTWSNLLSSLIGTWIGEAFFPIVLYFFIVRPYRFQTILPTNRRPSLIRVLLLVVFTVGLYLAFTPLQNPRYMIMLISLTSIGVGFAEEYSYRGVLTRVFRDRIGIVWSTILVSLLFSSSHWAEWFYREHVSVSQMRVSFLTIFVMAILFTVIAWRSGSLSWAALIHALNDFEAQIAPSYGTSWKFVITLMVCGVIGAELLRLVPKPKQKSLTNGF